MKTDTIIEIEENLKSFLIKYLDCFKTSSLHILVEEYITQKYLSKNKIYGYNIRHNTKNIKIDIQEIAYKEKLPWTGTCNTIIININQIERRKKLKKLNESSL